MKRQKIFKQTARTKPLSMMQLKREVDKAYLDWCSRRNIKPTCYKISK
jgi:hypothetical protein